MHVTPACAGSGDGFDHFGSYVCSLSLHFCKRLFPGLEIEFFIKISVQLNQSTPMLLECNTGFKYIKKEP
jgi:hypothetical protein